MPPRALPFAPLPPSLADIIFGENDEALLAALALATGAGADPCVYVWGAAGVGKSCLLRAACQTARAGGLGAYRIAESADAELPPRATDNVLIKKNIPPELPPQASGLLVVDDVQQLSKPAQEFLFDWHNRMAAGGGRRFLLCAGNAAPAELAMDGELKTRLAAGLVFRLRALDDAQKQRALQKCAARRGFKLPDNVAALLLERLPRAMQSLEAALESLDSFLLTEQKPLTPKWARAWLAAHLQKQAAGKNAQR